MKGLIALDIDGTLTPPGQAISDEVVQFLKELEHDQWQLLFITGRSFAFGYQVVQKFPFPYYFAVQNGAIILEMPHQKIIHKLYLDQRILPVMDEVCEGQPSNFIIYSGFENQDICYFRSRLFSKEIRNYLKARTEKFKEKWIDVPSFKSVDLESFPSVKCFGELPSATLIAQRIETKLGLHVPLIRDPFDFNYYVAQATHAEATKGGVVRNVINILAPRVVIAAGDDYNDQSMLAEAHIKIVMATAPQEMLATAHVIAPSAEKKGIIDGLQKAIAIVNHKIR